MNTNTTRLALVLAGLVLAGIDQLRQRGTGLTTWAVIATDVALAAAWWTD